MISLLGQRVKVVVVCSIVDHLHLLAENGLVYQLEEDLPLDTLVTVFVRSHVLNPLDRL